MTFSANKTFRDTIQAALADDLPAHVTTVAAEQGIALPAIRDNYLAETASMLFPSTLLSPPRGSITDDNALVTKAETWVLVSMTGSKPEVLEAQLTAYTTAIVRCFTHGDFGGWWWEATEYDMSPQTISESSLLQTAAVKVSATIIESAD